jgi:hypothetical protein
MQNKIKDDQEVMQPILKYLLMAEIQHNSIGLRNTTYHCDYTRAHTGHVMCNLLVPVHQLSFNSRSARSVHCQTLPGISFLLYFPE